MLGELIGAGASLLGGLLGGDSSSKTREKSKTRTKQYAQTQTRSKLGLMVKQAEKAGFNPLTVLSAGGLGAYSNSTTSGETISRSKSRGKNVTSSSAPLGAGIAAAGASIGNALSLSGGSAGGPDPWGGTPWGDVNAAGSSPIASRMQEFDLVKSQLASDPGPGTVAEDGGNPMLPGSAFWWSATPALGGSPEAKTGDATYPWPAGTLKYDKAMPDASTKADRYGDAADVLGGIQTYAADYRTDPAGYNKMEQSLFRDAGQIFKNATRNFDQVTDKAIEDALRPTINDVANKARSYWDTFEDNYDKSVAEVRSVVAPYIEHQFEPALPYGGRVDNRGYPRITW